ncbi:hypothetical protein [Clostridium sp.]|uniref:hypothetical protein n=1 Tax=Clostridium sp. TaxID=1506 RepID=UPI0025B8D572|nr:hypothetical protein [Clostridium sp.]
MKKCAKCEREVTTKHKLCERCRNYYTKRARLKKIKKHKLFFINNEEVKLVFTENENKIKELLKESEAVIDFATWKYPISIKLLKQLIEIIEFRLNANVDISSKMTKCLVEFIEENKIILKENE